MSRPNKEDIRKMTFGKFDTEEDYDEKEIDTEERKADEIRTESKKTDTKSNKKTEKRKKPSVTDRFKKVFVKERQEEIPEIWTGQTSVLDILAPSSVDNGSRDYVVVDGIYHSYLYIAGYGYRTKNEAAWLSPLVEAGDNIGISFTFRKLPREKILSRISQKTMLNRSRMREVGDTRQDFEELDDAISSGFYLKEGMNRANQDFYYMTTVIEVTASDEEELEQRVADVMTLCSSMSMVCKRADYKHEQCFLSSLPVLSVEPDIERKARRNVLTDSLAAAFPFSSFEIYDESGIFLGLNKYNRSVAILDIFDSDKYSNANGCILGMSGAGKTFLMQCLALRLRMQGTQIFILAPLKGHEFADACNAIGGKYIRIAPSSQDCINIMEIRKTTLAQLADRYPIKEWEEIVGNCDSQLFLGCNDTMTSEFISKRCGNITIQLTNSMAPQTPLFSPITREVTGYRQTKSNNTRPLMYPEEVLQLDNKECLLLIRGQKPLKGYKIIPDELSAYKELEYIRVSEYVPKWHENEEKEVVEPYAQPDKQVNEDAGKDAENTDFEEITSSPKRTMPNFGTNFNEVPETDKKDNTAARSVQITLDEVSVYNPNDYIETDAEDILNE